MLPDYRHLFQSVPGQYLILSPDFKIIEATDTYLHMQGVTREAITGKEIFDTAPYNIKATGQVGASALQASLSKVLTGKQPDTMPVYTVREFLLNGIPHDKSLCIINTPVLDDTAQVKNIIHAVTDVTETERLKQCEKTRNDFFTNVSHDLRAPLHVISGYAQILMNDYADKLDADIVNTLRHIKDRSMHMGDLIANLSTLSRVSSKPLEPVLTDMRELVLDALSGIRDSGTEVKAEIKIGKLPSAYCDPTLLKQVWGQLINNALKFSAPKAQPVVEIGSETINRQLTYYVKDNGVGFDMDYVHKLFQPFERLHHEDDFQGTALGLATAQRIIERHGGQIWAEAKEHKEASFYFTLPGIHSA